MADQSFLEWPFFEEHHRNLAEKLELWAQNNLKFATEADADTDQVCQQLVRKLGEEGWLKYTIPGDYGGKFAQLDVRSLCLIREILARYSGLADFSFAMQGLGSATISLFGSEQLKENYLPAVGRGEKIAAFALTEPGAGSDAGALTTTATKEGDSFILNGTKTLISNGGIADYYVVFARSGGGRGARGLSAFVVDAESTGLSIDERISTIAPHPLAKISLKNCVVPASQLLGDVGSGFKYAMSALDIFRSTVGAAALGFARHALDEALKRAGSRQLFGAPMNALPLIQAKIGDMALEIDASALLIYRSAWTKDNGADRVTREAAMAKLFATEAAQRIIDEAVQIFGGQGVISGQSVELLYREIRALRIYEGASEVQRLIIANQTFKQSR
ncbi:MAG: acyl-CoA dehydrogenase [Proteobacteria bacterium]|nr:acyl-CoA dehydrogenase [Pseudomonadota bacterium]